jgi:hypothetical protein
VSQQFLDGAQIGALLEKMCPKSVAKRVRMHVGGEPAQNSNAFHDAAYASSGKPRLPAGLAKSA